MSLQPWGDCPVLTDEKLRLWGILSATARTRPQAAGPRALTPNHDLYCAEDLDLEQWAGHPLELEGRALWRVGSAGPRQLSAVSGSMNSGVSVACERGREWNGGLGQEPGTRSQMPG